MTNGRPILVLGFVIDSDFWFRPSPFASPLLLLRGVIGHSWNAEIPAGADPSALRHHSPFSSPQLNTDRNDLQPLSWTSHRYRVSQSAQSLLYPLSRTWAGLTFFGRNGATNLCHRGPYAIADAPRQGVYSARSRRAEYPNGEELLRASQQPDFVKPDIIVTDHLMPRVTGLEMLKKFRSQPEFAPFQDRLSRPSTTTC